MKKIRRKNKAIICLDLSSVDSGYVFSIGDSASSVVWGSIQHAGNNVVSRSYAMACDLIRKFKEFKEHVDIPFVGVNLFIEAVFVHRNPRITKDLAMLAGMVAKGFFDLFAEIDPEGDIIFEQIPVNSWRGLLLREFSSRIPDSYKERTKSGKEKLVGDRKKLVTEIVNGIMPSIASNYVEQTNCNVTDALGLFWYATNRDKF